MKPKMGIDWREWRPDLHATLMFIVNRDRSEVLLIRKKRGLGAGKINGPGGKVDPGESALECAIRETEEELEVTALRPIKHGELWFEFTNGLRMLVHVYLAEDHAGEAQETEEAIPLWTGLSALPFEEMWEDDRFWLKELLIDRAKFTGKFLFEEDKLLAGEMTWNGQEWHEQEPTEAD